MIPYIYSAARETYDTGVAFLRPMYYDYPEAPEAYDARDQYMFGDSMLVAPITAPMDENTKLATKTVWLPPGTWIEWTSGARLQGPARVERTFSLKELPVYVKAGAIIPMQPKMNYVGQKQVDPLILTVFPGESGSTRAYEDEGNTPGYKTGQFAWTNVSYTRQRDGSVHVEVAPAQGHYPGMLKQRGYEIRLRGDWPPKSVAYRGAKSGVAQWRYEGDTLTTVITVPPASTSHRLEVIITPQAALGSADLLDKVPGELIRLRMALDTLNAQWPKGWPPDVLLEAAQTGVRITMHPDRAQRELTSLKTFLPEVVNQINGMKLDSAIIQRTLGHFEGMIEVKPAAAPAAAKAAGAGR
jgi:alpha-glucosidase